MKYVKCEDCRYWNEKDHRGSETRGSFEAVCEFWKFEGFVKFTPPKYSCKRGERIEK